MKHVLFLFMVLLLIACDSNTNEITLFNVEKDFTLSLSQKLTPQGSQPVLEIITTEAYPCSNAEIDLQYNTEGQMTKVVVNEIRMDDPCDNEYTALSSSVVLNDHDHVIDFQLTEAITNKGFLESNAMDYHLSFSTYEGIKLVGDHIFKIKEPLLWAHIDQDNEDKLTLLDGFFDQEEMNGGLTPGQYGLFNVNAHDQLIIDDLNGERTTYYWLGNHDFDAILQYVDSLDLDIRLYNYQGRTNES